jgi:CRISPR-associated exonuclease Cas4
MSGAIVTDLKQWAYCARIVYYRRVMCGVGKPTYKMEVGKKAQELIEKLEMRRGLREYGLEAARRRFGVWLSDESLGLAGKIDLVLETERAASVVDFKLTSGEPGENHYLQLAGYGMLVEAALRLPVELGFVYRIPDSRVYAVRITEELRGRVAATLRGMAEVVERQVFPEATAVRGRCTECEYANYCSDVW